MDRRSRRRLGSQAEGWVVGEDQHLQSRGELDGEGFAGRLVCNVRRPRLRLSAHAPWRQPIETALARLKALLAPT